jgi:serine/threonine-protein kinase 24/25/MST4
MIVKTTQVTIQPTPKGPPSPTFKVQPSPNANANAHPRVVSTTSSNSSHSSSSSSSSSSNGHGHNHRNSPSNASSITVKGDLPPIPANHHYQGGKPLPQSPQGTLRQPPGVPESAEYDSDEEEYGEELEIPDSLRAGMAGDDQQYEFRSMLDSVVIPAIASVSVLSNRLF